MKKLFIVTLLINMNTVLYGMNQEQFNEQSSDFQPFTIAAFLALEPTITTDHAQQITNLLTDAINISTQDEDGNTTLHLTIKYGYSELATTLITLGANIEARNNNGDTALLIAARYNRTVITSILLSKNADITAQTNYGNTVLHVAAWYGHVLIASLVGKKCTSIIMVKNSKDETALDFARQQNTPEMIIFLEELITPSMV